MRFRHAVPAGALLLLLALGPGPAAAAESYDYPPPWPASDVTLTVPGSQGSEIDALRALLGDIFTAGTGKKFLPRYVAGRGGADAWARMVDDDPDGSALTAVMLDDAYLRSLQPDSGVSLSGMAVCNVIAYMPCVLWTVANSPLSSLDDVTDAAAAMNGGFRVAGPGRYSMAQIASRALNRETGVRATYIPYTETIAAAKAVQDGKANVFWGYSVPVRAPGLSCKPIAVAAEKRLPSLPDTPTFKEYGVNLIGGVYVGLAVPVDTDKLTREEIAEYFSAVVKNAGYRSKAANLGLEPADVRFDPNVSPDAIAVFLAEMSSEAKRKAEAYDLHDQ